MEHASGPGLAELYQGVNLAVVLALIYFGAWKGIKGALQARRDTVANKLHGARERYEQLHNETQRLKSELRNLQDTHHKMVAEAQGEAQRVASAVVENAKQTADKLLKDAQQTAQNELTMAMAKLREEVILEALKAAQAMASGEQSKELHSKFVTEFSQGGFKNGN